MSNVESLCGRVRELDKGEELRHGVVVLCLEAMSVLPYLLPFQFHFVVIVAFCHCISSVCKICLFTYKKAFASSRDESLISLRGTTLVGGISAHSTPL